MRDAAVKFDPSIRQVTGESSCSTSSQTDYRDAQSLSSASSYMALPQLKYGRKHIPMGPLRSHQQQQCRCCEEETIVQNLCNKRSERLNKPCKDGFCYCFTSDSDDVRKSATTSTGQQHHTCKALRKEYAYNLPTDTDCSEIVTSDQYFAEKLKAAQEKKKKRVSLPAELVDSRPMGSKSAGCSHKKDDKCSNDNCPRRKFEASNKFKEFHCSDSDAPLIHIIQEVKRNTVVSEIRINRSKLKKSKVRSKSAGRTGSTGTTTTSNKFVNTDNFFDNQTSSKPPLPIERKDASANTISSTISRFDKQTWTNGHLHRTFSEDDDSRSDLSSAKPRSGKSKGGRLLMKRIGPDATYIPSTGPPRKPPRNISSSSDTNSLASEKIRPKYSKKKIIVPDNSVVSSIGDQPTMPVNFPLPQEITESFSDKDTLKRSRIMNEVVSAKPDVTKDTFEELRAKIDATEMKTSGHEAGYPKLTTDALSPLKDTGTTIHTGPSSRQEFTPTCPSYSEVASPNVTAVNQLLDMLPSVPTVPVVIQESFNELDRDVGQAFKNVDYADINLMPGSENPNFEQIGWAPAAVYNMLNTEVAKEKFVGQNPLAGPQQVGWQPPPRLQIDTVDGRRQVSANEDLNNFAASMAIKNTPVKPDIPKDEATPKNALREKVKNLPPVSPATPLRQNVAAIMPPVEECSPSAEDELPPPPPPPNTVEKQKAEKPSEIEEKPISDKPTSQKPGSKSFQKRALRHTKSFLDKLGLSKRKDDAKKNKELKEGKESKDTKETQEVEEAKPEPPKTVSMSTQTAADNVVLQGKRLNFDYASDDTLNRRSITPITGGEPPEEPKVTHHSDDGFDFSRRIQSPKVERNSQRRGNFTPRNFLKPFHPNTEKIDGPDESYKSYGSDLSEDLTVAVQDLLGKARAKLEGENTATTMGTAATNTVTDESVHAFTIDARADIHDEPVYAEIGEQNGQQIAALQSGPVQDTRQQAMDGANVVYAKVVKKGQPQNIVTPHRPAPQPPGSTQTRIVPQPLIAQTKPAPPRSFWQIAETPISGSLAELTANAEHRPLLTLEEQLQRQQELQRIHDQSKPALTGADSQFQSTVISSSVHPIQRPQYSPPPAPQKPRRSEERIVKVVRIQIPTPPPSPSQPRSRSSSSSSSSSDKKPPHKPTGSAGPLAADNRQSKKDQKKQKKEKKKDSPHYSSVATDMAPTHSSTATPGQSMPVNAVEKPKRRFKRQIDETASDMTTMAQDHQTVPQQQQSESQMPQVTLPQQPKSQEEQQFASQQAKSQKQQQPQIQHKRTERSSVPPAPVSQSTVISKGGTQGAPSTLAPTDYYQTPPQRMTSIPQNRHYIQPTPTRQSDIDQKLQKFRSDHHPTQPYKTAPYVQTTIGLPRTPRLSPQGQEFTEDDDVFQDIYESLFISDNYPVPPAQTQHQQQQQQQQQVTQGEQGWHQSQQIAPQSIQGWHQSQQIQSGDQPAVQSQQGLGPATQHLYHGSKGMDDASIKQSGDKHQQRHEPIVAGYSGHREDEITRQQHQRPSVVDHATHKQSEITQNRHQEPRTVVTKSQKHSGPHSSVHSSATQHQQPTNENQESSSQDPAALRPNISIGNPPVIEYGLPKADTNWHPTSRIPTSAEIPFEIVPDTVDAQRPLTSSTPQPPDWHEPIPSTSFNNSLEKDSPPRARALSKSDLSQSSDIFLENLFQKNVNISPQRSDEEKKSNLDSPPIAVTQLYYYDDSLRGTGDSSNGGNTTDNDSRRPTTSEDADYEDPCCNEESCEHIHSSGHDTVDQENTSDTLGSGSYKSCNSNQSRDENMNNSTSKDLNKIDEKPISKYESFKYKLRASFRKGKNFLKKEKKRLSVTLGSKSDNETIGMQRRRDSRGGRKGESDFEVDYLSAIELLNESSKNGNIKRQLEQTVSICRKLPELEASPEMVEAERLLLYSTLRENSAYKSNESLASSYPSTPKDFVSGTINISSFEIPTKPDIHHDIYFNYFYIGVFTHEQDIRSTQSAEKVNNAVFFSGCNMLFEELEADFEITVDLYVLRLRKLSEAPTEMDNVPVKIRKTSLSDSQEEVVSRFRKHGNFMIRAQDLAPFEVKSNVENISRNSEFLLVSNSLCTLPITLCAHNINLTNEVWLTASVVYQFKNFELSGFLNVCEMNQKHDWNKRWCQIDALTLYFWNYPQDCSEIPPILKVDLTKCLTFPIRSANREICPKPRSFQLDIKTSDYNEEDESAETYLFSSENQEEYNYWVCGLNSVVDFIRTWKVQVQ